MQVSRFVPIALVLGILAIGCQKPDTAEGEPSSSTPAPTPSPTASTPAASGAFASIGPVLVSNCSNCHGARPKEGIDLRTYDSVMKGGHEGAIVKAGDVKGSVLAQVLHGSDGKPLMPPGHALPAEDIKRIEDWISAGAKS